MAETPEEQAAREAEEAAAAAAAAEEGGGEGDEEGGEEKPGKSFSQDEVEKIVAKRESRLRKKLEKEAEEAKKKAEMSESEKLKAEKEEAEKRSADSLTKANQMLVKADAKVAAVAAGVKPERINKFLKLVDLSDIEVSEGGEPDGAAIKAAIAEALEDVPEFKGAAGGGGASGGDFGGDAGRKKWTQAEVDKLSPEDYEKHRDEILAQSKTGTMK